MLKKDPNTVIILLKEGGNYIPELEQLKLIIQIVEQDEIYKEKMGSLY